MADLREQKRITAELQKQKEILEAHNKESQAYKKATQEINRLNVESWYQYSKFDLYNFKDKSVVKKIIMLKGKKTYGTAIGSVCVAVGTWLQSPELMPLSEMVTIVVTSLLACFLRSGIKSDTSN